MDKTPGRYEIYERELIHGQEHLQTLYNDNFSFLGFDDFCRNAQQPLTFVAFCSMATHAAIAVEEIRMCHKTKRKLIPIMRVRLLDALYCLQNKVNEDIKKLKGTDNDRT